MLNEKLAEVSMSLRGGGVDWHLVLIVPAANVCVGFEQATHDVDVAGVRRPVEGGVLLLVGLGDASAGVEERAHYVGVAEVGGPVQRRVPVHVARVHVGLVLEKCLNRLHLVVCRGCREGLCPCRVPCTHVRPALDEGHDRVGVAVLCGGVERGVLRGPVRRDLDVGAEAGVEEEFEHDGVALLRTVVEGRLDACALPGEPFALLEDQVGELVGPRDAGGQRLDHHLGVPLPDRLDEVAHVGHVGRVVAVVHGVAALALALGVAGPLLLGRGAGGGGGGLHGHTETFQVPQPGLASLHGPTTELEHHRLPVHFQLD
mmetsp:Transcript_14177/g.30788  ORF Transcript_14177/g.30788 Transcript_14177/m.30788 type:complete len:316 (-) Transcript_14177:375-1322(-)